MRLRIFILLLLIPFFGHSQIINASAPYRITVAPAPPPLECDVFNTNAGITDPDQQSAICNLEQDLKDSSFWNGMVWFYPFVGGTSSSSKWNLKDPRDLDAAFRLTWNGSLTFSSTGVLGDHATGWAETYCTPSTAGLSIDHMAFGYYSRTDDRTHDWVDMGVVNSGAYIRTILSLSDGHDYGAINQGSSFPTITPTTTAKDQFITRDNSSTYDTYADGVLEATRTASSVGLPALPIHLFCQNDGGINDFFTGHECQAAFLYNGSLDATQAMKLHNIIVRFETAFGR